MVGCGVTVHWRWGAGYFAACLKTSLTDSRFEVAMGD